MLTRHRKAYSSFCSQTVGLSLVISSQFILNVHCNRRSRKSITLFWKFRVIDVDTTENSSLVLVVISDMSMPICNRFHERLANYGKITTFMEVPLFDALVRRFS